MYIKEIIINHYKSIKNPIHLRDFSGFHILVGPNNAGKTNVLDAINIFFDKNLEEERFFDKDTDVKMTVIIRNKKITFTCKNGIPADNPLIDLSGFFVRINEKIDYLRVVDNLRSFKENFPEEYQEFSKALEKHFKGIEINEELFLYNIYADEKYRSIKRMGEGFRRLFVILFYIFHPQYKIILIDEPESHLHPSIIKKLIHILETKSGKKQIFLTTHHPSFVQAKYLPNIWRVTRNEQQSTALYGFHEKDVDLNRFVQEINDDNSGMLFSDKVLLVEGISDAIFMREMLARFYEKENDIKVVYTSGKGTVDLYANLCEIFNIPYAIMLDSDAINSASLQRVKKFPKFRRRSTFQEKIEELKQREIFILGKDLEKTYPHRFKSKETKPLAALLISQKITRIDLQQKSMKTIKEIIERI
jgi:putative ATP-dependent endonuclease of the OLD family